MSRSYFFSWLTEMTKIERRTYSVVMAGSWLENMDTTIFPLVLPALIATLHLTKPEAGVLGTAALVGSTVGAWLTGILADRFGRIKALQTTIIITGVFMLLSAFANTATELFIIRFFMGIGFGGEAAVATVLLAEVITRSEIRGRAVGSIQSGYALGYATSLALMMAAYSYFPENVAWRVLFGLGVIPIILLFWIRRYVPESDIFNNAAHAIRKTGAIEDIWRLFKPQYIKSTVIATLLSTGILGGNYIMIQWLPTYFKTEMGMDLSKLAVFMFINILGSFTGPLLCGYASDRFGRKMAFKIFVIFRAVLWILFLMVPMGIVLTLSLCFLLGVFQAGAASGSLIAYPELFPTEVRASAQGFCIGVGRGAGSFSPALVGIMAAGSSLGTVMAIIATVCYGIALGTLYFFPETKGRSLTDIHVTESN